LTEVRTRIFATLAARPAPAISDRSGDTLSRLVSDVEAVQDLLLRVVVPGAAGVSVGALAVAGAAAVSPAAALTLAAGLLLAGVALPVAATVLTQRTADRVAPLRGALAVDALDIAYGAADLAAFGATARALAHATNRAQELAKVERRLARTGWAVDAAGVLVAGVTAAAVVITALRSGVDGVLVGVLAVGTLAAVEAVLALVGAARQWTQLRAGLRRVAALLSSADHGVVALGPTRHPGNVSHHNSMIDGVTVRYREAAAPALDGVTIELPQGRRVAVVGPSGAGKSTLLGVLTGAVRPSAGTVTLAGEPLSAYHPERLARLVGGLSADAHVFHATVRENLLLGRPDATEGDLAAACAAAGLHDWVRRQPDGWDTVVGEDGGQLSGGQRQRLALARALLADPAVLVLDEPTEGLDPATADHVLRSAIASVPPGRTIVLVTHRLRGLEAFDEVLVLDAGRIVQRGHGTDLVATPGWYRDQWQLQEVAERGYLAVAP
jgi:ATP-binding cassette subfamily C protein CydC